MFIRKIWKIFKGNIAERRSQILTVSCSLKYVIFFFFLVSWRPRVHKERLKKVVYYVYWRQLERLNRALCGLLAVEYHTDLIKSTFSNCLSQPRSQSSSAISDVTSPIKLAGKIHTRFQASSDNSDSANWPGYETVFIPKPWRYTISKVRMRPTLFNGRVALVESDCCGSTAMFWELFVIQVLTILTLIVRACPSFHAL